MLFTGDAEECELDWLVLNHSELLDIDILKASHHGSNNGYTDDFLTAVSPDKVMISAGVNKKHSHPHSDAVDDYMTVTNDSTAPTDMVNYVFMAILMDVLGYINRRLITSLASMMGLIINIALTNKVK